MKIIYKILILIFSLNIICYGQSTIITPGNTQPNITASSTTNGIVLPRMTTTQKNAISTLNAGMMVYDLDSNCVSVFNGNLWSCFKSNVSSNIGLVQIPLYTQSQINSFSPQIGTLAYNSTTEALYSSDGNKMNPVALEYLDGNEIQTVLPTSWANGSKIPVFRIRHPLNVLSNTYNRKSPLDALSVNASKSETLAYSNKSNSINQDLKIMPYQYGMAIDYNGVLESWVGEFSVHRGHYYVDMGDGGDGWGAVLWVGDDNDTGGLRMTARNNTTTTGGNIKFTEISSESFQRTSAGNLRLRLVDNTDRIDFLWGGRGSNNVVSFIGQTGIKFPTVSNVSLINSPIKGLTVFDDADSTMKVFTGSNWGDLSINKYIGQTGIKFPSVSNVASIASPIKGLTVFDNADSTMKVFTGAVWGDLNTNKFIGQTGIKFPSVSNVASIASPIKGLTVFDNADSTMKVFTGAVWGELNTNKFIGQTGIKFPSVNNVSSIASPIKGLTVFDNADSTMKVFTGAVWGDLNTNKFIGQTGIKFPSVSNVASIASPIKGLTVFDNADSTMKVYTGAVWGDLNNQRLTGSDSISNNKTLSYTSKQVQYVDASNGNIIITLPPISINSTGLIFKIIRVDGTSNSITVSVTDSSNTINSLSSKNIQNQFDCMNLYTKGKNKWIATREMGY